LSNGFSKKADNHAHSVAIHFTHYNQPKGSATTSNVADAEREVVCSGRSLLALAVAPAVAVPVHRAEFDRDRPEGPNARYSGANGTKTRSADQAFINDPSLKLVRLSLK
jgi:hypothetical protein